MEQNSKEWLEWRKNGLGASDAPIVMGVSPWKTRFKLWQEKAGLIDSDSEYQNPAMALGHLWEPRIRELAENALGFEMPAKNVEHKDKPYLRASLDGISHNGVVLECKYAGKTDHEMAKNKEIPPKYWPQVQHQLLVSGMLIGYYASFNETLGTFYLVRYERDKEYIKLLEAELDAFWQLVMDKKPPEMTNKDYKVSLDKEANKLANQYQKVSEEIKALEAKKAELKKDLISRLDHDAVILGDLRAQKVYKKGSIQYGKIDALRDIDLEQYRSDMVSYWKLF